MDLLLFGLAGFVASVVADVFVVEIDFLQFVQFCYAALQFTLHRFDDVQIL